VSAVPLVDADGHEPLPICRRHREWLIDYYKGPDSIVLRYFSDAVPVRKRDRSEDEMSVRHLRECPRCRAWVSTIVPEAQYRRQARLARYCCAGMFCAVEEHAARGLPRFSFGMFRGEDPCWQIDGENAFAVYCPWCGAKLPDGPFIKEES
jgi:hypothetical protein